MASTLRCISSMATRQILAELAARYEEQTGRSIELVSVGGVEASRRLRDGERFDLAALAIDALETLTSEGIIAKDSLTPYAASGMAIAAPAGAPRPGLGDEAAVKQAVLAARAVGYSTGPSGTHLLTLLKRWGVDTEMSARLVQAPPGVPVATLLARGEASLGFQQLSELLHAPGVEVLGPLPPTIQATTLFAIGVCRSAVDAAAANDFAAFLASSEAEGALRRHGMAPP
jgi:molybdate transport system substrate-binding protein